ncbi:MAG TPA: hypothetical protein ENI20_13280 [Bacteroides sp.]|nr:hypothetical protein [Bacteroides sp.]
MDKEFSSGGDPANYHEMAVNIVESRSLENFNPKKVPGYPVAIAIVYLIFGPNPATVILLQQFISILSIYLLIQIASLLFRPKIGLVAGIIYAFDPHSIFYSLTLMSETIFICIFLFAVYLLLRSIQTRKLSYFIYTGILLATGTYFKNVLIYFPLLLSGLLLIYYRQNRLLMSKILIMLTMYCMLLLPWFFYNYSQYGSIGFSTLRGRNMLLYNVAICESVRTGKDIQLVRSELKEKAGEKYKLEGKDPIYVAKKYASYSHNYIKSNLFYYSLIHLRGIRNAIFDQSRVKIVDYFMDKEEQSSYSYKLKDVNREMVFGKAMGRFRGYFNTSKEAVILGITISVYMIIVYASCVIGLFTLVRRHRYKILLFIGFILIYFLGLAGVVGIVRYKLPIVPFYSIISALGIWVVYIKFRRSTKDVTG